MNKVKLLALGGISLLLLSGCGNGYGTTRNSLKGWCETFIKEDTRVVEFGYLFGENGKEPMYIFDCRRKFNDHWYYDFTFKVKNYNTADWYYFTDFTYKLDIELKIR